MTANKTDKKPLAGRRIVITRAETQAAELLAKLAEAGADVLELPMIRIVPDHSEEDVADMFRELWSYEWIVFTSPNGVRHFFDLFFKEFDDIRALGGAHVAAIGKGTVAELKRYFIRADIVPETATSEALAKALVEHQTLDNLNILVITGNKNGDELRKTLESALAIVDQVQVYRTENTDISTHPGAEIFRREGADAIIFASGSAVESFVAQSAALKTAPNALRPATCSIGSVTSAVMREKSIPVDMEASEASVEAVVRTLCGHFARI
jgi:uroporphyrinogen III methyltransferase / synthase